VHERTVAVRGRRVKLFDGGDGPAVVLLHGLLGRPEYLLPLARSLARRRRVVVPALPGHGGSDRLRPFDFPLVADHLADAVATLGVESPAVLGHSYGVPVAVHWAARQPVSSLVCVSPIGVAPLPLDPSRPLLRAAPLVSAAVRRLAPALAATSLGRRLAFGWFVGMRHPDAVDPPLGTSLLLGAASAAAALEETLPPLEGLDLRPTAARVSCPAAVVWGDRDVHGPGNGIELAGALHADTVVLADVGHMPMLEAPFTFRRAIDPFI
jgi:pimeloyl-ACP methyl ester carboxylesterase